MTTLYVDISHHDRDRRGSPLDWAAIAGAGLSEVMCARATYGDPDGWHYSTRYFGEHIAGARAAGYRALGGYHNLIRGDDASINRQVDWLRQEMDTAGATWAMCDIEAYEEVQKAGLVPRWSDVQRWHDRWYAVEDRLCAWYLPAWFWRSWLVAVPDLRYLHGPLLQSHYAGGDGTAQQIYTAAGGDSGTGWDDTYGHRLPDLWQYTSVANVPGASNTTDVNAYRGTPTQLAALLNGDDDMELSDPVKLPQWLIDQKAGQYPWLADGTIDVGTVLGGTYASAWGAMDLARAVLAEVAKGPAVDPTALKTALMDPEVLAAIATAVNDDAARRLDA